MQNYVNNALGAWMDFYRKIICYVLDCCMLPKQNAWGWITYIKKKTENRDLFSSQWWRFKSIALETESRPACLWRGLLGGWSHNDRIICTMERSHGETREWSEGLTLFFETILSQKQIIGTTRTTLISSKGSVPMTNDLPVGPIKGSCCLLTWLYWDQLSNTWTLGEQTIFEPQQCAKILSSCSHLW
jgi:hypothetical protein